MLIEDVLFLYLGFQDERLPRTHAPRCFCSTERASSSSCVFLLSSSAGPFPSLFPARYPASSPSSSSCSLQSYARSSM